MSVKLGVNIDHVATVRQARLGRIPDVVQAALCAERAGADSITVHLREDRRHIQDQDVLDLKKTIHTKLNLEMSAAPEIVNFACYLRPHDVCLVPEKRRELTTEGGLDVARQAGKLRKVVAQLRRNGIRVSLFVDPVASQIQAAAEIGAHCVELHTGTYANARNSPRARSEYIKLVEAAKKARQMGLILNAGHGLDYENCRPIAIIPGMHELNIGFSIVARSIFVGIERAVKEMLAAIR